MSFSYLGIVSSFPPRYIEVFSFHMTRSRSPVYIDFWLNYYLKARLIDDVARTIPPMKKTDDLLGSSSHSQILSLWCMQVCHLVMIIMKPYRSIIDVMCSSRATHACIRTIWIHMQYIYAYILVGIFSIMNRKSRMKQD